MAPTKGYPWQPGFVPQPPPGHAPFGQDYMDTSNNKRVQSDTASDVSAASGQHQHKKRNDQKSYGGQQPPQAGSSSASTAQAPDLSPPPQAGGAGTTPSQGQARARNNAEEYQGLEEVWRTLEDHRRCIVNLNSYVQTDRRQTQWCLYVPKESLGLQRILSASKEAWLENRPDKGPHPHGDMCHSLWRGLLHHCIEYVDQYIQTGQNSTAGSAIKGWLEATLPAPTSADDQRTLVVSMYKIGNRKLEEGTEWRFIVRFNIEQYNGQQVHENLDDLLQLYGDVFEKITGFNIYHDRAPPSQAEKNLRKSYADKYKR